MTNCTAVWLQGQAGDLPKFNSRIACSQIGPWAITDSALRRGIDIAKMTSAKW